MKSKRPFGFVHDINAIYYTFNMPSNWFYIEKGHSEEQENNSGYRFDGQFFYRKVKHGKV